MPRKSTYARVSITLPKDILASADREAKKLDRPRSWVIAEAIRAYAAGAGGRGRQSSVPPPGASEVTASRG
jgi:metal-responsive CopG/Arc/MetJ family transcriptional regulator